MKSQASGEFERKVTHTSIAQVARLMGYTTQGLHELLTLNRLDSDWVMIGMTRRVLDRPAQRVNARVINGRRELDEMNRIVTRGTVQFSIGDDAFELSGDAKSAREIRKRIAEDVAKIGEMRRGPLIKKTNSQPSEEGSEINQPDQVEQASQAMIITPCVPRGPYPFRSC